MKLLGDLLWFLVDLPGRYRRARAARIAEAAYARELRHRLCAELFEAHVVSYTVVGASVRTVAEVREMARPYARRLSEELRRELGFEEGGS
jgi:hypothetical protein